MDLAPIIARITDQVETLRVGSRVLGAAELEAARLNPEQIIKPSAFVVWTGDVALDQKGVPGQQPKFREEFAIVVAVDNSVDRRGSTGIATVQSLKDDLEAALVGWAPDSSHLPIFYVGSTHVDMNASVLLHSLNYATVIPGGSIFTYTFGFRIALLKDTTLSEAYDVIASRAANELGYRMTVSDYVLDREVIPESETRHQVRMVPSAIDEALDSSTAVTEIAVEISVYHHFAPGDDERTYTEGEMATKLKTIMNPSYWRWDQLYRTITENPTLTFGADLGRE